MLAVKSCKWKFVAVNLSSNTIQLAKKPAELFNISYAADVGQNSF